MRSLIFAALSTLIVSTAVGTSPPAVDTVTTLSRTAYLSTFHELVAATGTKPSAQPFSYFAPTNQSCGMDDTARLQAMAAPQREEFVKEHTIPGFVYVRGYDVVATGQPVQVTWMSLEKKATTISEGQHMTIRRLSGPDLTISVRDGQLVVGQYAVPKGGVTIAMNGSIVAIQGCGRLG